MSEKTSWCSHTDTGYSKSGWCWNYCPVCGKPRPKELRKLAERLKDCDGSALRSDGVTYHVCWEVAAKEALDSVIEVIDEMPHIFDQSIGGPKAIDKDGLVNELRKRLL